MRKRLIGTFFVALITVGCTENGASSAPKAESAQAVLGAPLTSEQNDELAKGMLLFIQHQYGEAAPLLSNYARLGEPSAQTFVGMMYFLGKGFPQDQAEGIRWLSLAAAQGHEIGQEVLVAALDGALEGDGPTESQVELATVDEPFTESGDQGYTSQRRPIDVPSVAYAQPGYVSPYGAASRSALDTESASKKYLSPPSFTSGTPDTVVLNPSGPGLYVGTDGTLYTQAGPNGVVNTRTGQFSPRN